MSTAVARAARRSSHAPRALSLDELLASLEGGSRWAWQLEPRLAAIYETVIRDRYDAAASALRGLDHSPAGGLTAAASWSIPDPDELGLQLRAQFDDRWKTGETDAVRIEAMRRVTKAGLQLMRVNFDTRNPLVEGVLGQLGGNIGIAATTRKDIMRSLDTSWKTGLSIPNAAKAMIEAGASIAQSRAETIARTEMLSAVNGGAHALASLSNDLGASSGQPALLKIWLTAEDALVRDDHVDAGAAYGEGNGIPLSEPFLVGDSSMMYPGDQDGAADEVINCRCALSYEEAGASTEPSVSDTTPTEEPTPSEPEPPPEPSFSPSTITAPSEGLPPAASEFSSDASRWTTQQLEGMFQSDALDDLGLRVLAHAAERSRGARVKVKAAIVDAKGGEVARIDRMIDLADKSVYHESFFIDEDWQGKGIAKDVLRSSISEYEKAGIERVEVTAAGENGRYTWARFGFDFVHGPGDARSSFLNALIQRAVNDKLIDLGAGRDAVNARLRELYPTTVDRIVAAEHSWEFANMSLDDGGVHVADFGKQAMLKGRGWDGQLDLAQGSESRRIFDEYVSR